MHHPTDRIAHTTAFVTPVVEHWLERKRGATRDRSKREGLPVTDQRGAPCPPRQQNNYFMLTNARYRMHSNGKNITYPPHPLNGFSGSALYNQDKYVSPMGK